MSFSSSDSDEFFDAEDHSFDCQAGAERSDEPTSLDSAVIVNTEAESLRIKSEQVEERARRISERRERLLREEEETFEHRGGTSGLPAHFDDGSSSLTESVASSSLEGLYLNKLKQQQTNQQFYGNPGGYSALPEHSANQQALDSTCAKHLAVSASSSCVSRRGTLEGGRVAAACVDSPNEPDLVASTKPPVVPSVQSNSNQFSAPVAPPRKRKQPGVKSESDSQSATRGRNSSTSGSRRSPNPSAYDSDDAMSINSLAPIGLPPPPVETPTSSIGKDFIMPLENLQSAEGYFVVRPEDNEQDKGPSRTDARSSTVPAIGILSVKDNVSVKDNTSAGTDSGKVASLPRRPSSSSIKTLEYKTPEGSLRQASAFPRLRTDSGRQLSDLEILAQIEVLNLDTGEKIPLSVAEDKLPQCVNPLSLHLMRITHEYVSPWFKKRKHRRFRLRKKRDSRSSSHDDDDEPDENEDNDETALSPRRNSTTEVIDVSKNLSSSTNADDQADVDDEEHTTNRGAIVDEAFQGETEEEYSDTLKKKASKLKKKLGKKLGATVSKIKTVADEKLHQWHAQHSAEEPSEVDLTVVDMQQDKIKVMTSSKNRRADFDGIREMQALKGIHVGAVWTMKFSHCGRLLATGGQDHLLRIWVLRDAFEHFNEVRRKNETRERDDSVSSADGGFCISGRENQTTQHLAADNQGEENVSTGTDCSFEDKGPFVATPFIVYEGHTADVLDVSWSKSNFILSSSMDKTVRLWQISRAECLCVFHHVEFVTAIAFHPRDDRYFLSGSLDGKLRLWNILDKKVHLWNELEGTHTKLITSANFCQNGKFAVVGSYDGRCVFYTTEQLKYYTQIAVRSSRGKNAQGKKISGIEPMPGEDKILVTSNDSRLRLYDLRDLSLSCKYRGLVNNSSQIKATFSPDGRYVISGSENAFTYIWKTYHDHSTFSSARRDRNAFWESIKVHDASVTSAVFAPKPDIIMKQLEDASFSMCGATEAVKSYVIVSADFRGDIRVLSHSMMCKVD